MRASIVIVGLVVAASAAACASTVEGRDTRDLGTVTSANPTIAGAGVGDSCGWADCRADLVCNSSWQCAYPDPAPLIACTLDAECTARLPSCNRGLCAALAGEGERCATSSNCVAGFQCSDAGRCRSISAWCTATSRCPDDDVCVDNACEPRW